MNNFVTLEFEIDRGSYDAVAGGNRSVFEYQGNFLAVYSQDYVKGISIPDVITVRNGYIESKILGVIHRVAVLSR